MERREGEEDGSVTDKENGGGGRAESSTQGETGAKMAIIVMKSTSRFPVTFFFTGVSTDNTFLLTGTP